MACLMAPELCTCHQNRVPLPPPPAVLRRDTCPTKMLYCASRSPHRTVLGMQLYSATLAGQAASGQACLPQRPRCKPSFRPCRPRRQCSVRCSSAEDSGDGIHAPPSSSGSHSDGGIAERLRRQALQPTGSPAAQVPVPECLGRRQLAAAALSAAAAAAAGALPAGWAPSALAAAAAAATPCGAPTAQQLREFKVSARD